MRLRVWPSLALVALLLASGCGADSAKFQGHWVGHRKVAVPPGGDASIANTLGKVEIIIKSPGRFEMLEGGLPKAGTVRYAGGKAYLRVDTLFDKPLEQSGAGAVKLNETELTLTPVGSDRLVFVDSSGFDKAPVELAREAQPS